LDKVDANVPAVKVFAQAARRIFGVGQNRKVSFLDDQPIEKREAALPAVLIVRTPRRFKFSRNVYRGSYGFEVNGSGVAGSVRLMVG